MRKTWILVMCMLLTVSFAACSPVNTPVISEASEEESSQAVQKELLKIRQFPFLSIEQPDPSFDVVDLDYSKLREMETQWYSETPELQFFTKYISENYGISIDEKWKVMVHYYDTEQTSGMLQFQYWIGEIGTNKSILFFLNDGKVDMISHSRLDMNVDEKALLNRVALFQEKYEQEPYLLKEGETFMSDTTDYTYYYDTEDLVYCYAVFFTYNEGLINNDYGTTCKIDENGNAVECYIE